MKKINKHFVSEIDKKLAEFNQSQTLEPQQQAEKDKYDKIYATRDQRDQANCEDQDADLFD